MVSGVAPWAIAASATVMRLPTKPIWLSVVSRTTCRSGFNAPAGELAWAADSTDGRVEFSRMRPEVRFCTSSDGVRLAYAIAGNGPPMVRAPHWFTHLEHDWTNPAMRPWVQDLSKRYTLLRFDQRGTGLSDREVPEISLEAHVRDLEAVVDATGFERFALLGPSQGAAFAIVYAARHPERVSHLILYGGFARGREMRGSSGGTMERRGMSGELVELSRGTQQPPVPPGV